MLNQSVIQTRTAIIATMTETIKSRFGEIEVDTARAVLFPRGILGMPDKFNFVLTAFPNAKMQQFTLLQSLDEHSLSFITLPLDINNAIISADDIKSACRDLQFDEKFVAPLLIVSVHRLLDGVKLSVNARAPILIDANKKVGVQYVFQNEQYKVQHML